jgi:hypothetical protein
MAGNGRVLVRVKDYVDAANPHKIAQVRGRLSVRP